MSRIFYIVLLACGRAVLRWRLVLLCVAESSLQSTAHVPSNSFRSGSGGYHRVHLPLQDFSLFPQNGIDTTCLHFQEGQNHESIHQIALRIGRQKKKRSPLVHPRPLRFQEGVFADTQAPGGNK